MSARFDRYFAWLIPWEGSAFEDDPSDPGGATRYGIDQRSHPDVDIRHLTEDAAKAIYLSDYWSPVRAEELPWPVGEVVMDIAVNNGRSRAAKWLQERVGVVADGIIGRRTIEAVKQQDAVKVAVDLIARREAFYQSIAKGPLAKFLRGWLNRNHSLRDLAQSQP